MSGSPTVDAARQVITTDNEAEQKELLLAIPSMILISHGYTNTRGDYLGVLRDPNTYKIADSPYVLNDHNAHAS
jgi:hypothetical protein